MIMSFSFTFLYVELFCHTMLVELEAGLQMSYMILKRINKRFTESYFLLKLQNLEISSSSILLVFSFGPLPILKLEIG